MINQLVMRFLIVGFFVILIAFAFVLALAFGVNTFAQSNSTLSNNTMSNASTSDESSFASLSRSLAETNQSEDEPVPPLPPSQSGSEDQADGDGGSND